MNFFSKKKYANKGFTLVELLVTMGIFTLLTSMTVANYRSVDNTLLLNALANKVALSVRQAQISGTATRQDVTGTGTFTNGYGINFTNNSTRYIYFIDRGLPGNKRYDSGELLETYNLGGGFAITDICVNEKTGTPSCGLSRVDVTFIRPNPDATIQIEGNECGTEHHCSDAEISFESLSGSVRKVVIWVTGQISIE